MLMKTAPSLPAYRLSTKQVYDEFDTSRQGLDKTTAKSRLAEYGQNKLETAAKESIFIKYLRQYKDGMIILLLTSSILFYFLEDARTSIVLLVIVLFNTSISFNQEYKAERIMDSLERLVVPIAKALRAGKLVESPSTDLVPGDIVYIEEGDSVPADLRIIEQSQLSTNDFALTGESNPTRKFEQAVENEVELADRRNMVFMGTTVAQGHGFGVVIGTGMNTELGRIASLSQETDSGQSPLQKEIDNIAKRVTWGTLGLVLILMPMALAGGLDYRDAFLVALGIAASLIPQGLPAVINTVLAQAAGKLAKAGALVKRLSAVETLGSTSIICSDKTGTLTKNQMTVQSFYIGKFKYQVTGSGYDPEGEILSPKGHKLSETELAGIKLFLSAGLLSSNAKVNPPDEDHPSWHTLGDPTEGAIITLARKGGLDTQEMENQHPEKKEFAFDSVRKLMSSIRPWDNDKDLYVFVKGAPEELLAKCDHVWDHGLELKLTKNYRSKILDHNQHQAEAAMRNLGFAYKKLPHGTNLDKLTMQEAESDLIYLGMVSMMDPLREEVVAAMQAAHQAQIGVAVVTGDYSVTAKAIAVKAGLAPDSKKLVIVTGQEARGMDDEYIVKLVAESSVIFSRVSPEDKLRIVTILKNSGQVVAVTGDGINDAPALKRADIGVAMGVTGTDVSKQSADIILLDDSFGTLVKAVQEGRTIFNNIRKISMMAFSANSSELVVNLFSLAGAIVFDTPLALSVMLILGIDLIAELFPMAAISWDKADHDLMKSAPRDPKAHILNRQSVLDLAWVGLIIGALSYANYILFFGRQGVDVSGLASGSLVHMKGMSLTYLTIVLCQLVNILLRRSDKGLFTRYQLHNYKLWLAMGLSLFCVANIIYNPIIAPYFDAGSLGLVDWLYAGLAAIIFLAIREIQRHTHKHSRHNVLKLHRQVHGR
jgi:P-type Ca2+ transporter type 2C